MDFVLCVGGFKAEVFKVIESQWEFRNIYRPSEAIEYFSAYHEHISAVLMSLKMKALSGLDAMEKIHRIDPEMPVVISTHDASVDVVVDAMQRGAYNYLYEPRLVDELPYVLARAQSYMQAVRENRRLHKSVQKSDTNSGFVGISPAVRKLRHMLNRVADSSLPVLFVGESGTGKEVAAHELHSLSPRHKERFVPVNCGALSPSLLEAELFGYEKGAFTGARTSHAGLFEQAHGGTLFLDEIGLTGIEFQAKLLRVLQNGEIRRVGAEDTSNVDTRVMAATNADLEQAVEEGTFREDLMYRLNVLPVYIPPLRERPEDITVLVTYFLEQMQQDRQQPLRITPEALRRLEEYAWPGNVRELQNVLERAALMAEENEIQVHHLPELFAASDRRNLRKAPEKQTLKEALQEVEIELVSKALSENQGNRSKAARRLGIKRTTLIEKLKRFDI